MRIPWAAGLLLSLLAVAPLAAAQVTAHASSLSSPQATDLQILNPTVDWFTRTAPVHSLEFRLQAKEIHSETDSGQYVQAGLTSVGNVPPTTARQDYDDAVWDGANWGNETSLFLIPHQAHLQLQQAMADVTAPSLACHPQTEYIGGVRDLPCVDTSRLLAISLQSNRLVINGSFDVYLWGWEGTIKTANGSQSYWVGEQYASPQTGPASTGPSERRFAVLQVTDGLLELLPSSTSIDAFADSATLTAPAIQLLGSEFTRAADAQVIITRSGAGLSLEFLSGTLLDQEGHTVAVQAGQEQSWSPWLLGGILGAVVVAGWMANDSRARVRHAADNLAMGNPLAAHRHARRAQFYPWTRRKAQTLAIIALLRAEKLEGAQIALSKAHRLSQATRDFLSSFLLASQGDTTAAREALQRSIQADEGYRIEAQAHPLLRDLLDSGDDVT